MSADEKVPVDEPDQPANNMTRYGAIRSSDSHEKQPLEGGDKLKPITDRLKRKRRSKAEKQMYENNIKVFLDALLSNTSLLAVSNIVKRRHPILKTLWTIALLLCLILTIRQLYSLSATYFSHPKSTNIELSYRPFDFPSVTVCNHNPLRRSNVALFGRNSLKAFVAELETKNYSIVDNGTQLMTQQADWLTFHKLISNYSIEDRQKMGYQLSDFILQCNFAGKKCDPKMFSASSSKTYGNCFTFNGWQSHHGRVLAKNGREHGLIMTFYLELDEYLQNFIPSSGAKVHVHEPGSMAFPEFSGFSVPPGFQSSIGVSQKMISRIDRENDRCEKGEKFQKSFGFEYTFSACAEHCKHTHILRNCKCYDRAGLQFYGNNNKSLHPCQSAQELDCMIKMMYTAEQGDLNCSCLLPCEESHYMFKQSISEWPTDSYEMRLFGDLVDMKPKMASLRNETKNLARRNLLKLLVYMDGLMTEHIIEKNSYELDSYLSDIGGTLGLFLGFSVLTGFELIEACALVSAYLCGKIIYSGDEEEAAQKSGAGVRKRSGSRIMSLSGSAQSIHLHSG